MLAVKNEGCLHAGEGKYEFIPLSKTSESCVLGLLWQLVSQGDKEEGVRVAPQYQTRGSNHNMKEENQQEPKKLAAKG